MQAETKCKRAKAAGRARAQHCSVSTGRGPKARPALRARHFQPVGGLRSKPCGVVLMENISFKSRR